MNLNIKLNMNNKLDRELDLLSKHFNISFEVSESMSPILCFKSKFDDAYFRDVFTQTNINDFEYDGSSLDSFLSLLKSYIRNNSINNLLK